MHIDDKELRDHILRILGQLKAKNSARAAKCVLTAGVAIGGCEPVDPVIADASYGVPDGQVYDDVFTADAAYAAPDDIRADINDDDVPVIASDAYGVPDYEPINDVAYAGPDSWWDDGGVDAHNDDVPFVSDAAYAVPDSLPDDAKVDAENDDVPIIMCDAYGVPDWSHDDASGEDDLN